MQLTDLSMPRLVAAMARTRPWLLDVAVETEERGGAKILVIKYQRTAPLAENPRYLRYSRGPASEFAWDVYGDDFQDEGLVILALVRAPDPQPRPWLEHRP